MMKTLKLVITLFFLSILMAGSCKKDKEALPKASQSGANIMAAKINGKNWQREPCWSCIGGGSGLNVEYYKQSFTIKGQQKDNQHSIIIDLVINDLNGIGNYPLVNEPGTYKSCAGLYDHNSNSSTVYYTSANSTGWVYISKLDTVNKIISGTFEFTAEDKLNPANTIHVTEGRFDVKYQ